MSSSLLDLSDRVTLQPLARLLAAVRAAAGSRPLLLVGAAARDLLLVHGHHIAVRRATEDTDVALAVPDWFSFLGVRDGLIASTAFRPDVALHRLWFGDQRLDFIPFGGVERLDRTIAWPPESAQVMNVSGFAEALATAVTVRLPGGVDFDVASLPALALLKIWAWNDRKYVAPGKDAEDLLMLLQHYADAVDLDRLYGRDGEAALTSFDFDLEVAGAWLLGRDSRDVLGHGPDPARTLETLNTILRPEIDLDGALLLVAQMPPGDRARQLLLLTAFHSGLSETATAQLRD